MGAAITGLLVLSILFTSALMFFRVGLFGDVLLGNSFEDAQELLEERRETRISIGTTTIDTVFRCETQINLTPKNIGDVSISEFDQMDFIPWYIPDTGDDRIFQFTHTGGNLDTDEWSVSSIDGDSINPGILDPGETANLTSRLKQQPKPGELGYVTVATPGGISASKYVDFEDAISGECFYLHHDPSPPTNHTDRPAAELPWGDKLPSE